MTIVADITPEEPNRITLTGISPLQKDQVSQLPGSRWDSRKSVWHAPIGWATSLAIKAVFRTDFEVGPGLAAWIEKERTERVEPAMALREAMDAPGDPRLYDFQRAGVQFMKVTGRALCADEMGTGKTRPDLTTLLQHHRAGTNPFPALVIAPNSTKIAWSREAEIVWPGLTVQVVNGTSTQRRKQLKEPAHIYVMNWEAIRSHSRLAPYGSIALKRCQECGGEVEGISAAACHVHPKELNAMRFASVIVDEAHRMKDARSQQTRAIKAASGDAEIRMALTGTPIASAPDDLWSILNWLSPNEWPTRTKFVERMLEVSYNAFGASTVTGVKAHMQEEFFAALDPRMRRMPKALVLSHLPPVVRDRRDVEMSPKQKKAYTQMRDKMVAELDDDQLMVTTTPLTRVTRMLQFASSYAELVEVTKTKWIDDLDEHGQLQHTDTGAVLKKQVEYEVVETHLKEPSCKIDAFMTDLPDFEGDSIVVFAVSRKLIELLSAKLTKAGVQHGLITGAIDNDERQWHMDEFQAGRSKLILCTTGAGGTGITLTAARIAVYLQRPWSMIENAQSEARIHRIGSEIHSSILIVDYTTSGTIEETVIEALATKSNRLEEILRDRDLLRRTIEDPTATDDETDDEGEAA